MKKTTSLTVLFAFAAATVALTLAGAPAHAQKDKEKPAAAAAAGGGGYQIAVVDMGKLMKDYKKREQKYAELQKEVDSLQAEIDVKQKGIETARSDYEKNREKMSDDERSAARLKIENEMAAYKADLEQRQRKIDSNEELVLKEVVTDIQATIAQIAVQEGYHLVLNSGGGPRASVLYSSTTIDITPAVLAKLNGSGK